VRLPCLALPLHQAVELVGTVQSVETVCQVMASVAMV
jgi:hypothetical protein